MGTTLLLTSPVFGVKEIMVMGSAHLTSDEVVGLCNLTLGANILKVQTGRMRDRISAHPRVERVTVSRQLPDRLVVNIIEREGVALILCQERYAELDVSGRPLEFHRFIGALGLPIVTGVEVEGVTLGARIGSDKLLGALACANALGHGGRAIMSEINLDEDGELTLYTREGVPVYFGPATGLDAKAGILGGILEDIAGIEDDIAYIDVRYPRYPVVGALVDVFQPESWPDPDAVLIGEP
jgi:cell division protein FtsQ